MDIEEFEKQVEPRAKRSKLEPFQAQIFELKAKGYANWQVCEWLAANDVKVSQEAVRKFIKSREGKAERVHAVLSGSQSTQGKRVHAATLPGLQSEKPAAAPQDPTPKESAAPAEEEDLSHLTSRERRERRASQFIKEDSSNPLLKKLKGNNP